MAKPFRLKRFDPVFFISHLLFVGLSYTIYLAPFIAPSTFPYFGFIPIFYPILALLNLVFLIIIFLRRRIYAILFLILNIGLLPPLNKSYQYFGDQITTEADFKVITYNVHYLRSDGFADFFNREDADLILLQETYWRDDLNKELKDSAFADYYHERHGLIQIFSKYPIIEFQKILSEGKNTVATAAYADLDLGYDTIRIVNVYLETMLIDKKWVKASVENGVNDMESAKENSKILKNKLTTGFLHHQKQVKKILPYIYNSPHPVLLAGDLNAVPNSYEYQQINYFLKDAYVKVGQSPGTSFHDFKYPLRLDYLFYSDEFLPVSYRVLTDVNLSDHYPVVGTFRLPVKD